MSDMLNVEALIAPISEVQPCGTAKEHDEHGALIDAFSQLDLAFDLARKIERARATLDAMSASQRKDALAHAAGGSSDPRADPRWKSVTEQSVAILTTQSKDLRAVAMLIEAAVRWAGFPGLRDAMRCCAQLIEKYGDELFPRADTLEDTLFKYLRINSLNNSQSLLEGIQRVSFMPDKSYHFAAYTVALQMEKLDSDEQGALRSIGVLDVEDFEDAIKNISNDTIQEYLREIDEAREATAAVDQLLGTISGKAGYGLNRVVSELERVSDWFKGLTEERSAEAAVSASEAQATSASSENRSGGGGAVSIEVSAGALRTREEALNSLLKVAKYFRTTEPHSPLSYLLEQAVRWGKMGLPDLLRDLVQNEEVLKDVFRYMGIQEKDENNS